MGKEDTGKLGVICDIFKGLYRIAWVFEDDIGGYLGQSKEDGLDDTPKEGDDWAHWAASKAVLNLSEGRDEYGLFWETESGAKKVLRVAKAATKQDRPLPEWALKALENGWKAPKNWKP